MCTARHRHRRHNYLAIDHPRITVPNAGVDGFLDKYGARRVMYRTLIASSGDAAFFLSATQYTVKGVDGEFHFALP